MVFQTALTEEKRVHTAEVFTTTTLYEQNKVQYSDFLNQHFTVCRFCYVYMILLTLHLKRYDTYVLLHAIYNIKLNELYNIYRIYI